MTYISGVQVIVRSIIHICLDSDAALSVTHIYMSPILDSYGNLVTKFGPLYCISLCPTAHISLFQSSFSSSPHCIPSSRSSIHAIITASVSIHQQKQDIDQSSPPLTTHQPPPLFPANPLSPTAPLAAPHTHDVPDHPRALRNLPVQDPATPIPAGKKGSQSSTFRPWKDDTSPAMRARSHCGR